MQEQADKPPLPTVALWALVVYTAAFLPRIVRAWAPREELLSGPIPDDAFYYFEIARNIVDGNGASFDGEHVTNGFHPLWQALITPLWVFDGDLPINLALTFGAIFGGLTAMMAFLFLQRATESLAAALLGSGFYALHPQAVFDSVNGLESSVTVMLLAAVLLSMQRLDLAVSRTARIRRSDLLFGVLCGLLMLARTDMVFVVVAVLLFIAARAGVTRWLRPATMGAVALLIMIPWFAWSYIATGSVVQISGRAGGVYIRDAYTFKHGDALSTKINHGLHVVGTVFRSELPRSYFIPEMAIEWPLLVAGFVLVALIPVAAKRIGGRYADAALMLAVVAAGFAAGLAFHGGVRWFTRTWYYTPAALLGGIALGMVIHAAVRLAHDHTLFLREMRREVIATAVAVVVAVLLVVAYKPHDPFDWAEKQQVELQLYDGARWLDANTPEGTRVGSFNAGTIGYFSERTVVNLDGVVNEGAYHAIDSCQTTTYIREERLEYLIDFSAALGLANCGPPVVSYEVVGTLQTYENLFGALVIWKVVEAPR